MERVRRHVGIVSGLYEPGEIDRLRDEWPVGSAAVPIAEVADWLPMQLGQQLTSYLSGVRHVGTVRRWRSGRVHPRAASELRLRAAYRVVRLIADAYDGRMARAWLLGSNGRLGGEAPARLIREAETSDDLGPVVDAARVFVGRGADLSFRGCAEL